MMMEILPQLTLPRATCASGMVMRMDDNRDSHLIASISPDVKAWHRMVLSEHSSFDQVRLGSP